VRPVEVRWRLFSLEEINKGEDKTVDWENGRSAPTLRVLALVRRQHGEEGVDRLYDALAEARFKQDKKIEDPATVEGALEAAGFDRGLRAAALADPTTREEVEQEHAVLVGRTASFGVPTLVLDDGAGPEMFGPVIDRVPEGEEAGQLWDRFVWLMREPYFFEVKRARKRG
jgi:predicted DsbA family dithiol-disulfide isomerase